MHARRQFLAWIYPVLMKAGKFFGAKDKVRVNQHRMQPVTSLFDYSIMLNDGSSFELASIKGKKILLVNTASDCGYTAQYEALQQLSEQLPETLTVIAFPANDFKEQEKGSDAEIAQFCKVNYGVNFPVSIKSSVTKGPHQHPVFQWLSDHRLNGWCDLAPHWNFTKYLVDEDGFLTHYFPASISPLDPMVTEQFSGYAEN